MALENSTQKGPILEGLGHNKNSPHLPQILSRQSQEAVNRTHPNQRKQMTKDFPGWKRGRMRRRARCRPMAAILALYIPGGIMAAANHGPMMGGKWHRFA